jgi:hypothetical protein
MSRESQLRKGHEMKRNRVKKLFIKSQEETRLYAGIMRF